MPERWLVFAHEATNSGAPRMLLRVLQGVKAVRGPDWECEVILRYGGALQADFAALGPVQVLASPGAHGRTLAAGLQRRLLDHRWRQPRRLARILARLPRGRFDLVYCNTGTNGALVTALRQLGCPVLTHVHELGASLRRFSSPAELTAAIQHTDHFLAVSPAVAEDLVECGAPSDRITVVPNFLPELPPPADEAARNAARAALGVPLAGRLVVGCGHLDRVKGPDLFVELAAKLADSAVAPVELVWLGEAIDVRLARALRLRATRGRMPRVRFVGPVPDPHAWFAAADVVAVTSRAERFSLVALEAGALGRPVVAFAGARGPGFVLGERPELLAPGFDVAALAGRTEHLLRDPAAARGVGAALRERMGAEFLAERRLREILAVTEALRERRVPG